VSFVALILAAFESREMVEPGVIKRLYGVGVSKRARSKTKLNQTRNFGGAGTKLPNIIKGMSV
jgi:hypothetical protein